MTARPSPWLPFPPSISRTSGTVALALAVGCVPGDDSPPMDDTTGTTGSISGGDTAADSGSSDTDPGTTTDDCIPRDEVCHDPDHPPADEDCDGLVDCADESCVAHPECVEVDCGNGVDDDGDGEVDCDDFDCAQSASCAECSCANMADDDADGDVDCDDIHCEWLHACVAEALCDDATDDDGDGLTDCADPDCSADPACGEQCTGGTDDDGDGLIDCVDLDCVSHAACACTNATREGHTYLLCNGALPRDAARAQCLQDGFDLATIDDAAENQWVVDQATSLVAGSWWIGLNDQASEGTYVWADGSPVTYTNWFGSEPNNLGNEDCVAMPEHSAYTWNDVACGQAKPYVCEGVGNDQDEDGVPDVLDNCPDVANPGQEITPGNTMGDACMWPNQISRANSDPWISEHHDDLRLMRPRVLVINYANGIGRDGNDNVDGGPITTLDVQARAQGFLDALEAGSRFHGYRDTQAPAFIQPEIWKVVDLQDGNGHANSDAFPRGAEATTPDGTFPRVGYAELFEDSYAHHFDEMDPGGDYLNLAELVDQGLVHDVIIVANQIDARDENPADQVTYAILEVAYVAQAYDGALDPAPGLYVRNGCPVEQQMTDFDECDNSMAWTGRSLRIFFLNASRGPGCLMHSLGHAFEHYYNESEIYSMGSPLHGSSPMSWVQPWFRRFGEFDLQAEYGMPFPSLYRGGETYDYEDCDADGVCHRLAWFERYDDMGNEIQAAGQVDGYVAACGNVHYPPGARRGYEYYPPDVVLSTCETFMQPDEVAAPVATPWRCAAGLDDDCGGQFLVYWMQNMPGFGNHAQEPGGAPMRNWWPLMYY